MGDMELVKKAIELAKKKRISQRAFAMMIGAEPSRLSEWKNGKGKPSIDHLVMMGKVLEVSLDTLVYGEEKPPVESFTQEEQALIGVFRGLNLTVAQASELLSRRPATWGQLSPEELIELQSRLERQPSPPGRTPRKKDRA